MKKHLILALAFLSTVLAVIGAHSLADRFDPTSRATQKQTVRSLAGDDSPPCSPCDYLPS